MPSSRGSGEEAGRKKSEDSFCHGGVYFLQSSEKPPRNSWASDRTVRKYKNLGRLQKQIEVE
jgi:hypothetical protein